MKLWIKSYTEKVDDPKFCSLSWEQRGIFDALCDLAGIYDHKDENQKETGRLDTVENVAFRLRCTEVVLSSSLDAFRSHKMVHVKKGTIYLTNFAKRQARPDSSQKTAVLERVHKHRAKSVTPLQPVTDSLQDPVTPLEENRLEENRLEESREEIGADAPAGKISKPAESAEPTTDEYHSVTKALEEEFSRLTGLPLPPRETKKDKSEAGKLWWNPLMAIFKIAGEDTEKAKSLMDETVAYMSSEKLTFDAPISIVRVCRSQSKTVQVSAVASSRNGRRQPTREQDHAAIEEVFRKRNGTG